MKGIPKQARLPMTVKNKTYNTMNEATNLMSEKIQICTLESNIIRPNSNESSKFDNKHPKLNSNPSRYYIQWLWSLKYNFNVIDDSNHDNNNKDNKNNINVLLQDETNFDIAYGEYNEKDTYVAVPCVRIVKFINS